MNLTACSNRLVSGLVEMLTWAARNGRLDEADRLLAALHLMRPKFVELHAYDAWLLIRRNRMTDAAQLLRQLEGRELQVPFGPYVTSLLAVCLSSLGDPGWRVYANEVLTRDEDAESVGLMNLLTGQRRNDEPNDAQARDASASTADLLRHAMSFSYLRA